MNALTIEAHGKQFSGLYSVHDDVLTVAFNGAMKEEAIEGGSLILVARRLLRELVSESERVQPTIAPPPRGGGISRLTGRQKTPTRSENERMLPRAIE